MANDEYSYYPSQRKEINFRELLDSYLRYWRWFLFGAAIALIGALLYLRFTLPTYIAVSTIIIEDEKSKGRSSDTSTFADLGLLNGLSTSSIENELGLLRSKRLMTNAVKALNLNIQYLDQQGIPQKEVYKQSPVLLRLIRMDEVALLRALAEKRNEFGLYVLEGNRIRIEFSDGELIVKNLGDIIELDFADFVVEKNEAFTPKSDEDEHGVDIKFVSIASAVSSYQSNLGVELVDENSTLIQVSIIDNVKRKAQDILDQLIFEYNQEAIEDKNLIARNTAFFIDERLNIINSELDSVETGKEQFKEANSLTDMQAESSIIIQNVSEYNNRQQEVNTQLELTNAMIQHLNSNDFNLLPTNLGIDESGTSQSIDEFNTLLLERNRLLKGATERNPLVVSLDDQIRQIKNNVKVSLERRKSNLRISRDNLRRQAGILGSQISAVPGQERQFRGIERQQNIKEALYLFLLQKREENSLSLAAKAPKAKLVDQAYSYGTPISPNPKIILTVALLSGLFLPFLVINVRSLLDNKIRSREGLKKFTRDIPLVGEVPHIPSGEVSIVTKNERSLLTEAFNILSANLQYVVSENNSLVGGTCIYITSSTQGEGKTFSAINLGMTLALSGKSVIVIGADLRNPQLQRYEDGVVSSNGLSSYLSGNHSHVIDFIEDSKLHSDLKLLPSGPIPPNPTQLLRNDKIGPMFDELKNIFDYIIVDTAPAMLLADTFLISKYADLTLYMIRAGQTKNKVMEFALEVKADGKLKNMAFLLNDVKLSNTGYGHKYGYAYGNDNSSTLLNFLEWLKPKTALVWVFIKRLGKKTFYKMQQLLRPKTDE